MTAIASRVWEIGYDSAV